MSDGACNTYYLLRSKTTTVGGGPYVGLSVEGQCLMVPEQVRARRFSSLAEAEEHAGKLSSTVDAFEIEVRTAH